MKFTLVKDLKSDALMRPLLMGLLLFILLFLALDILNVYHQMGLSYSSISTYIYGNEEEYIDPVSFSTLLEHVHQSIFIVMMLLLTLSAIYARVSTNHKKAKYLIHTSMISALVMLLSLMLAPYFAVSIYLFIVGFWFWHASAIIMSVESLLGLK